MEKNWFNQTKEEVLKHFSVDAQNGLSAEQVKKNQEKYGLNELKQAKKKSIFIRFLEQFKDFMIIVLIIAAKIPVCPNREIIWTIGFWAAVFAIVFCVVRGLPVVIEAKYLFEKKND